MYQAFPLYFCEMNGEALGLSTILVISPLKALIADQLEFLNEKVGIYSVSLNKEIDDKTCEG